MRNLGLLSIMPKIPEISVGIQVERFVSVSPDWNIRDHLWRWSTCFDRNIPTESRLKNFKRQQPFLLVGPISSENVVPFSSGIPTDL